MVVVCSCTNDWTGLSWLVKVDVGVAWGEDRVRCANNWADLGGDHDEISNVGEDFRKRISRCSLEMSASCAVCQQRTTYKELRRFWLRLRVVRVAMEAYQSPRYEVLRAALHDEWLFQIPAWSTDWSYCQAHDVSRTEGS